MRSTPRTYLFIAGTPRSGTSAVTELLSTHPQIALGMERYKYIYGRDVVGPEHFQAGRFERFLESDTNITPANAKHRDHYSRVLGKQSRVQVVGDKYPLLYRKYTYLSRAFEGRARFLFIVRAIQDVSSSWNVRALSNTDKWPEENDFRRAVAYWNDANRRTLEAIKRAIPILVIAYESLFDRSLGRGEATIGAVLRHIGLEDSAELLTRWGNDCEYYDRKVRKKRRALLPDQESFVSREADYELYRHVLELADRQLGHHDLRGHS